MQQAEAQLALETNMQALEQQGLDEVTKRAFTGQHCTDSKAQGKEEGV